MASRSDEAEQLRYDEEVKQLNQWWTDSRWRYTRRPYSAEQIANKRGNITIQYPSNVLAKKLWKTVEERFAVRPMSGVRDAYGLLTVNRIERQASHMAVSIP